ncbi:TVP38/TMEM64 family protein [Oribacterium sp. oral taxon 108]|uniref:TVP38/TMEM64 family protein n=1 Tax=Oribacterium sp. oral taxon 108 TaxID=712414 RepID=UPI00020DDBBF|nr:TVP38/TMEM64 family protein [Oribacterium sp. oral taxon 108]EGL38308.1 SNARE-like domain protein [Oribacterium sp. oral taxon 108 str. F0425]
MSKKSFLRDRILLFLGVIAVVALYFLYAPFRAFLKEVFRVFATGDFQKLKDFVASYGPYAAAISFLLMVLQSVVAPLPAFLITFANAALFGFWKGALLSWSSAMVGAALCFFIARSLGREAVEKLTSKGALKNIDDFFKRHGKQSILIARLLPFISFDIVSYAAGLSSVSFLGFWVATGLGQLPATLVYSYVGGFLTGGAKLLVTGLLILFALAFLIGLGKQLYTERQKSKEKQNQNIG